MGGSGHGGPVSTARGLPWGLSSRSRPSSRAQGGHKAKDKKQNKTVTKLSVAGIAMGSDIKKPQNGVLRNRRAIRFFIMAVALVGVFMLYTRSHSAEQTTASAASLSNAVSRPASSTAALSAQSNAVTAGQAPGNQVTPVKPATKTALDHHRAMEEVQRTGSTISTHAVKVPHLRPTPACCSSPHPYPSGAI